MRKRVRAHVGLGSNLGNAREHLRRAVRALDALAGTDVVAVSPLYRTRPVGVVEQPDFLNAVVALDVPAGPDPETGALALLGALKQLEVAIGRRPAQRWGPREIDLDLLLFGDHAIHVARDEGRWLEVPHPEMAKRLFVLAPLADIAPDLRPPGWAAAVAALADRRRQLEGDAAVELIASWRAAKRRWTQHSG